MNTLRLVSQLVFKCMCRIIDFIYVYMIIKLNVPLCCIINLKVLLLILNDGYLGTARLTFSLFDSISSTKIMMCPYLTQLYCQCKGYIVLRFLEEQNTCILNLAKMDSRDENYSIRLDLTHFDLTHP